ncbi:hypothetical protein [Cupriavidus necator]|uniref:hypothetical protein n=1 Tax=Cupriavidus necator TaxID=106590 RepID=UPI0005B39A59|nr:hypothetical protein [Cupriavidus necator]
MQSDPKDTSAASPDVRLAAGQSLRIRVVAGAVLRASAGEMDVAGPPQWLADTCHMPRQRLRAGDTLVVPARGWLEVAARRPGALAIAQPPGLLARLKALLMRTARPGGPVRKPASRQIADPAPEKL